MQRPSGLAPFLPTQAKAWRKTTDRVREQLKQALPEMITEPGEHAERLRFAIAVRSACRLAFDARSYSALRSSIASLSAVWTAGLVGVAFAVIACLRWGLSWPQVFVMLVGQGVFLGLAYAIERFVFPGVLHWGFGSPRWTHTARLYGRTIIYLAVGIGALVAFLTLADRHHHLEWLERVGLVAPLGCLAVVVGLWTAVGVQALGQLVRPPLDPYPELITSLLEAYYLLGVYRQIARDEGVIVLPDYARYAVASVLERPARALETDAGMCARFDGEFCTEVAGALRAEGAKVAAWLHKRQEEILAPSPDAGREVKTTIGEGFKSACDASWNDVKEDPPKAPAQPSFLARMAPRIGVALALLAAAFAIPAILSNTLSAGAGTTLTVTLVLTAVTALAAPSTAVSTVASDIAGLVKPPT